MKERKSNKPKEKEDSKLEEKIERKEVEKLKNILKEEPKEIEEFIQKVEIKKVSPSLEMINSEPSTLNLEQSLAGVNILEKKEEEEIDYSRIKSKKEEQKYQNYENSHFYEGDFKKRDLDKIGNEDFFQEHTMTFVSSKEIPAKKDTETNYISGKKVGTEQIGRDKFLEERNKKRWDYKISEKVDY